MNKYVPTGNQNNTHRHPPDGYAWVEGEDGTSHLEPITHFDFAAIDAALGWNEPGPATLDFDEQFSAKSEELFKVLTWLAGARDLDAMAVRAFILVWIGAPQLLSETSLSRLADRLKVSPGLLTQYIGRFRREVCDGRNPGGQGRTDEARANMAAGKRKAAQ